MPQRILFITTSHAELGSTGRKTGVWIDELAVPYMELTRAGHAVDLASPRGGPVPLDPGSLNTAEKDATTAAFLADETAQRKAARTAPLNTVDIGNYDALFFPGGHGAMWDLPGNPAVAAAVERAAADGRVIAAVCHGVAGLVDARGADGQPLVAGKRINSFTDEEERAVGLTEVVPFLLEGRLRELGAKFESGPQWAPYAVRDGRWITGQNPASSLPVAQQVIAALAEVRKAA